MSKGGRTATTWQNGWNSGNTTSIRVSIALKDHILAYARAVDSNLINDEFQAIPLPGDFLRQFTLSLIDRYIEYKRQIYHPNQNSKQLDISTRAWDELRKFQNLVRESPELVRLEPFSTSLTKPTLHNNAVASGVAPVLKN